MQCPFLKEAQVESCRHATMRKMIVRGAETNAPEKCLTPQFSDCAIFAAQPVEAAGGAVQCPFFERSLMQYCGAASIPKYIPYSEAVLSRCGTDAFRYCDLYLAMAHPNDPSVPQAEGVMVPPWLWFASNHMWLDVGEDGSCHVGIDGLLAKALGTVDRISFVGGKGEGRPAVTLTVRAVDIQLVFPNPLLLTGSNVYLRANPSQLTADPYRQGWLFEGKQIGDGDVRSGLMRGDQALLWMEQEVDRVSRFVHEQIARADCLVADGGGIHGDFARYLDREQIFELFHRFFSPWTR